MQCENHAERAGVLTVDCALAKRYMCPECSNRFAAIFTPYQGKREAWETGSYWEQYGGRTFQQDNKYLNSNHIYTSDKDLE